MFAAPVLSTLQLPWRGNGSSARQGDWRGSWGGLQHVDEWGRTSQKVSQLHLPKSMWCWAWTPSAAPSTAASRASGAIPSD